MVRGSIDEAVAALLAGGGVAGPRPPAPDRALAFGFCITATSANLSGQSGTANPASVARSLAARIDCLLDGGPSPGGPPSTMVELREGVPVLVRAGAIAWDRVLRSIE